LAAAAVGVALSGALLVPVGSIGYAAGIAAWVVWRRRDAAVTVASALTAATLVVPWLIVTRSGGAAGSLWSSSIPAQFAGSPSQWLLSRPVLVASTFWGIPPPHLDHALLDVVISFFFFSTTAVLAPLLLLHRGRWRVPEQVVWAIAGGVLAGFLLLPTNTAKSGLAETVYTANILLVLCGVATLDRARLRRLATGTAAATAVAVVALIWRAWISVPGDPNAALGEAQHLAFWVRSFGVIPGALLLGLSLAGVGRITRRAVRGDD
jgi:hypothetical protein